MDADYCKFTLGLLTRDDGADYEEHVVRVGGARGLARLLGGGVQQLPG